MLDMGAEPFLLVSSLNCVVGQRVLRKVCKDCVKQVEIPVDELEEIKKTLGPIFGLAEDKFKKEGSKMTMAKVEGCDKCNNTGYLGRIAIYEVMPVSEKISKLIVEKASAAEIQKQAMTDGMLTMKQDGYIKVLEGVTTMDEVIRVAQY
jgi:type IV pilus assembly protein PilB